jgi:sec-independent protein translocase protein TatA
MPTLGPTELIVILLVVILLFGAKKLPELARSIGDSMKELRKGFSEDASKDKKSTIQEDKETS